MNQRLHKSRFDWLTSGGPCASRPEWDTVLCETDEFAAIPSLGSLVAGWILIVPKRPMANLAELSNFERKSLLDFTSSIIQTMEVFGENVYQFEHGGLAKSPISCGVEQAHLHLVPLPFDLIEAALTSQEIDWTKQSSYLDLWERLPAKTEYLMMSDHNRSFSGIVKNPTSQWFRKLIAANTGQSKEWNYKLFPNLGNIDVTLKAMAI